MQVSGLGIEPITAAAVGGTFLTKLFGGGDVNYANNFSASVGVGKKFLQTEADAYYARSNRIGVSAFDIARMEVNAGRALSDSEVLALAGKAPLTAIGQPPAYPEAFTNAFGPMRRPHTRKRLPMLLAQCARRVTRLFNRACPGRWLSAALHCWHLVLFFLLPENRSLLCKCNYMR
jgi:hypothetical protein